jgi:hypothetical protein
LEIQKLKRFVPPIFFLKRKGLEMAVQDFEFCPLVDELRVSLFSLNRIVFF